MTDEESFEFKLEIPISSPPKTAQKQTLISSVIDEFLKNGAKKAELKDSFYVDKKGADFLESINLIVNVVAPYATLAAFGIAIYFLVKSLGNGRIKIKKPNGKKVFLKEGMTEEEVKKALAESDEEN